MRLIDLARTTSFRLALRFLVLFGAASLLLLAFLFWRATAYLTAGVDEVTSRDLGVLASVPLDELLHRLSDRTERDIGGQRPTSLFDPSGNRILGSLHALPLVPIPLDKPFEFTLERSGSKVPFRGLAHRLPSGDILVVSRDVIEMHELREILFGGLAWGSLLVLAIGLGGAALTGIGALRRIDGVTSAIERIVGGDLTKRLPLGGKAGDLERLVHVVNGMLDEIERLMREVKGVSDAIAHDLRTPLTRLLAGLERARRREGSRDASAAAVDAAIAETKGILATFAAILRISEVEGGARLAGFTPVDLARIANDAAELYAPLAEAKGMALVFENQDSALPEIAGDRSLLFEAIGNLIDNAVKFTPTGGRIEIRVLHRGGRCGVSVSDTGPGIPPEEREAVLGRFYRAQKSRHTPGSGLGLSLVAAVAKLHGFDLVIDDANPGCRVTLSRVAPAAPARLEPARSQAPVPA